MRLLKWFYRSQELSKTIRSVQWIFVFFSASLFLLIIIRQTPWWPNVSLLLKHRPLCFAVNHGLISPRLAHYSPISGETVDILRCVPKHDPVLSGQPLHHEVVVVSDFGRSVQRIGTHGQVTWKRIMSSPRGIDVQGSRLFVADGMNLYVLNTNTGEDILTFNLLKPALAVKIDGEYIYIAYDADDSSTLVRYKIEGKNLREMYVFPVRLQYPRGIDLGDGILYVADTFGNRILGLDAITGIKRFEVSSHFPNSIQFTGESVLVAEEHLNSATDFSINLKRQPAKLACRTVRGLADMESMRTRMNAVGDDGESLCRVNSNIFSEDLFSPNDYQSIDGFSYVADTDNNRIIVFDGEAPVSIINGFNSPVNIRVLNNTDAHSISK